MFGVDEDSSEEYEAEAFSNGLSSHRKTAVGGEGLNDAYESPRLSVFA